MHTIEQFHKTGDYKEHRRSYEGWLIRKQAQKRRAFTVKGRVEAKLREWNYRELTKLAAINIYSNGDAVCKWCGQGDIDVLSIDHIDNSGDEHRRTLRGKNKTHYAGTNFYRWLIKNYYPLGYQVLCLNCNWKKMIEWKRARRIQRWEALAQSNVGHYKELQEV